MASVLLVTNGLSGILYSSLELARRLAAAGHEVTYASPGEACAVAAQMGFECQPLKPSRYTTFLEEDGRRNLLSRFRDRAARQERALDALDSGEMSTILRRVDPDLVLIDGEMHEQIIVAASTSKPVALLNSFASIWCRPGLPPPHHQAQPGVGWRGSRAGMWILWQELRVRKRLRRWSQRVRTVGCDRVTVLRLLAERYGFDFDAEIDSGQWLIPFTYRRLPALSLHAREFEFPHEPPDHVRYLGPMVAEARTDHRVSGEVDQRVATLLHQRQSLPTGKLIYAGFGSVFSTDASLVGRLIEAVGAREHWTMILALGDHANPPDLERLPPNVHVLPWVPQLEVLREADVTVTHGGINTIDESILSGVPLLVFCGGETDMAGNTARVVHHGLGLAGEPGADSRWIRQALERLLEEPEFRENVARLRTSYRDYSERRVAEQTIQALIDRSRADDA